MSDRKITVLFVIYGFGWLADWAYWAVAFPVTENGAGAIWGFFLAVGWPVRLLAVIWQAIL